MIGAVGSRASGTLSQDLMFFIETLLSAAVYRCLRFICCSTAIPNAPTLSTIASRYRAEQ
jgi:hypothetical protein